MMDILINKNGEGLSISFSFILISCYFLGPNQVVPTDNVYTTKPDGSVKLRVPKSGMAIETTTPISVPGLVKKAVDTYSDHTALAYKENGEWKKITYT